jgi:hypothetical protein
VRSRYWSSGIHGSLPHGSMVSGAKRGKMEGVCNPRASAFQFMSANHGCEGEEEWGRQPTGSWWDAAVATSQAGVWTPPRPQSLGGGRSSLLLPSAVYEAIRLRGWYVPSQ